MSILNGTRIKICGITNAEDARAAVEYGADALGFIFVPDSPRYVLNFPDVLNVPAILPPFVTPVAVYKELTSARTRPPAPGIHTFQYYGLGRDLANLAEASTDPKTLTDEAMDPLAEFGGKRLIRAFRIKDEASLDEIDRGLEREAVFPKPHALLLDAYHPDKLGGAGVAFNWDLAVEAKARFGLPIILAGGLTPDNVAEAVQVVRPYAVDVASGVEAEPGRKDHSKLRAFIRAVRDADR